MTASLAGPLRDAFHSIECGTDHPATDHMPWDIEGATEAQRNDPLAGMTEALAALRADPAVREAVADTLMDLRMDGPWFEPPSPLSYQEAMRHYADVLLDALLGAQ